RKEESPGLCDQIQGSQSDRQTGQSVTKGGTAVANAVCSLSTAPSRGTTQSPGRVLRFRVAHPDQGLITALPMEVTAVVTRNVLRLSAVVARTNWRAFVEQSGRKHAKREVCWRPLAFSEYAEYVGRSRVPAAFSSASDRALLESGL